MSKKLKAIKILTVISSIAALVVSFSDFIISFIAKKIFEVKLEKDSAVQIIGGADGPTAIFISSKNTSSYFKYVLIGLFCALTVSGIIIYRKIKNKK